MVSIPASYKRDILSDYRLEDSYNDWACSYFSSVSSLAGHDYFLPLLSQFRITFLTVDYIESLSGKRRNLM
jgi:hypothetical protein